MKSTLSSLIFACFLVSFPLRAQDSNIVEIAQNNPVLRTLTEVATAAGLANALTGKGPFTLFAPNDNAFDKVDKQQLQEIQKEVNQNKLIWMLRYHVVMGKYDTDRLSNLIKDNEGRYQIKTITGMMITAILSDGEIILTDEKGNSINILENDIKASNGVVHIIDAVMMPQVAKKIKPNEQ
jgi:uncharacterized surface protein with fasciclin (FAS1) repeats